MALSAACFALGIALARLGLVAIPDRVLILTASGFIAIGCGVPLLRQLFGVRARCVRVLAIAVLAPMLLGWAASPSPPIEPPPLPEGPLEVAGTIVGTPRPIIPRRGSGDELRTGAVVRLESIGGRPAAGDLRADFSGDLPIGRGDRVSFTGRVVAPGLLLVPPAENSPILERAWIGTLDRGRRIARRKLRRTLSREGAAWGCALLLGDRGFLAPSTRDRFRSIGQGHLLAISGLHVGMLYAGLRLIARRLPRGGGRIAPRLIAALLVGYAGIAGADPPVLRAACFGALALLALRGRTRPRLPELWIASFLILAAATEAGLDVGFWLSFFAVAAIAIAVEHAPALPESRNARWRSIDDRGRGTGLFVRAGRALRIATAAWIGAHLILVHVTPDVVPAGPLISLLYAPWLAVVLAATVASLVPGLDLLAAPFLELVVQIGETLALEIDRLPGTPATWPCFPPVALSLFLVGLLAILIGRRTLAAVAVLFGILVGALLPLDRTPAIFVPDLGRGQAILVRGESATLLLDAGSVDRRAGGAPILVDLLWRSGCTRIDAVIVSHAHADHVLAIPGLLERIEIGQVIVGPRFDRSLLGRAIVERIDRAGVPLVRCAGGDRWRLGAFEGAVHHPPRDLPSDFHPSENDDSLVVTIRGEGIELLAPGDLEGAGLAALPTPPPVTTLILPHHGRSAPGIGDWIENVAAPRAIASGTNIDPKVRRAVERAGGTLFVPDRHSELRLEAGSAGNARGGSSRDDWTSE